jgi:hypothetical protein
LQEYKDVSIWYGISGYVVATGTGFFRMYNDRHWLTDVAAGAGIGILCTKTAIGCIKNAKTTFQKKQNVSYDCSFYNGKEAGISRSILIFQEKFSSVRFL